MGKLEDRVAELEKGIANGFNEIEKSLTKILSSMEITTRTQSDYDKRYVSKQT